MSSTIRTILIFTLIFNFITYVQSVQYPDELKVSPTEKIRNRRSNFPCGRSFVPCTQPEEGGNEIEGNQSGISFYRGFPDSLSSPSTSKTEVERLKKLLDLQSLQFLTSRVKYEVDRLYNETEVKVFDEFKGR